MQMVSGGSAAGLLGQPAGQMAISSRTSRRLIQHGRHQLGGIFRYIVADIKSHFLN